MIHNNFSNRMAPCRRWIIQVSALSALMVVYLTTMAITGHGRLGFDSGEGPERRPPHPRKAAGA